MGMIFCSELAGAGPMVVAFVGPVVFSPVVAIPPAKGTGTYCWAPPGAAIGFEAFEETTVSPDV